MVTYCKWPIAGESILARGAVLGPGRHVGTALTPHWFERHRSTSRKASRILTVTEAGQARLWSGLASIWPRSGPPDPGPRDPLRAPPRLPAARLVTSARTYTPTIPVIAASDGQNAQIWTASALAGTQPTCVQIGGYACGLPSDSTTYRNRYPDVPTP